MRRSHILIALTALTVSLLASAAVSAQTGQLRGHVLIKQADGTEVPAAGAQIDTYRTDIPGKYPTKANKRGEFVYAGLPFVGVYTIAVSAPNAAPTSQAGVRAGRDIDYKFVLEPGDGRRLTEDEAKGIANAAANPTGKEAAESAAEKAKREEELRKYEAERTRVTNVNETLNRTFKMGNDALVAKNYGEAIKQFDEGLVADPNQVVFYSLKSSALRGRGVDHYNASVKAADATAKASEMEEAKKDFQAAAQVSSKGVELAKAEPAAADPSAVAAQAKRKLDIMAGRAESMRLLVKVDPTQAAAGVTAYNEYMAIEADPVKKAKAEKELAQLLFESASDVAGYERAIAAYQKILDANPEDTDAILRMGQALFNIGALSNDDKAKYQEAANYLQKFVDKAPEGALKTEAKDLIAALKAQANVTPDRTPTRRRRP